ncbi:tRNA uracil54-C5-methyltransferase [Sarcoptes scabiei]|nr:tRNA uracil54-C5-methyltransferase [Sarcoptes scabiei]
MLTVPRKILTILFLLCFILNAISIGLCLSALFLLILAFLDLGHLLGDFSNGSGLFRSSDAHTYTPSSSSPPLFENFTSTIFPSSTLEDEEIVVTTTPSSLSSTTAKESSIESSDSLLPESNPDQLNLIFYLLFYLAVAILGLLGASRHYHSKKISYLTCHVILLFSIIVFNLLAWFHFRHYSPLYTTNDDPNLLLASLFDFVDFLVGFSLLISLLLNRYQNLRIKQRNSITPINTDSSSSSASSSTTASSASSSASSSPNAMMNKTYTIA